MISVLTDGPFFGGSFTDLSACRTALESDFGENRPYLLCKEFVLHPVQLDYALHAGADTVLLIARIVSANELGDLMDEARSRGFEPLVEVATHDELPIARDVGAKLVGVNARDLDTLQIDRQRAADILARLDASVVAVHLSGLSAATDVAEAARGRSDAALIGEALMRRDDPTPLLQEMMRAAATS
jgi:indole-3-glycerol phosphate synthase